MKFQEKNKLFANPRSEKKTIDAPGFLHITCWDEKTFNRLNKLEKNTKELQIIIKVFLGLDNVQKAFLSDVAHDTKTSHVVRMR